MTLKNLGANKVQIEYPNGAIVLFSYSTPVAANWRGAFYRINPSPSVTTSKHINQWLAGAKAESRDPGFFTQLAGA